jgi:hypothetical protein
MDSVVHIQVVVPPACPALAWSERMWRCANGGQSLSLGVMGNGSPLPNGLHGFKVELAELAVNFTGSHASLQRKEMPSLHILFLIYYPVSDSHVSLQDIIMLDILRDELIALLIQSLVFPD